MSSAIQQGLLITAIGMGLVFAVIIFLWWLMGLIMRVTSKEEQQVVETIQDSTSAETSLSEIGRLEAHRRAAAAAVAVGLALRDRHAYRLDGETQTGFGGISPWQIVHRVRQLEQHNKRG